MRVYLLGDEIKGRSDMRCFMESSGRVCVALPQIGVGYNCIVERKYTLKVLSYGRAFSI